MFSLFRFFQAYTYGRHAHVGRHLHGHIHMHGSSGFQPEDHALLKVTPALLQAPISRAASEKEAINVGGAWRCGPGSCWLVLDQHLFVIIGLVIISSCIPLLSHDAEVSSILVDVIICFLFARTVVTISIMVINHQLSGGNESFWVNHCF